MEFLLAGITIVPALAWCVTALCRRASAAWKHAVWTCALAAILALAPLRWRMPQRAIAPVFTATIVTTAAVAPVRGEPRGTDPTSVLPLVWALGSLVMMLRLLRDGVRLRAIVRSARGSGLIRVCPAVRGPLVAGLFRPVILLPEASHSWTPARREAVLAHEAAHIRRHDPAILLAAHLATAVYWFHPLCWLTAARLRAESERACDDAVLGAGLLPSDYAGHLLDLACKFDTQLATPMATTSQLETRMKSILNPTMNRSVPARAAWVAAFALTAAVLAPLTTLTLRAQQADSLMADMQRVVRLASQVMSAQQAVIAGTVTDPTGAVVANAPMTITNSESGWERTTTTNASGTYTFDGLPAGHYTFEARSPGFAKFQENLAVVSGGRQQADARLAVGRVDQRVVVAGKSGAPVSGVAPVPAGRPLRVGGIVQAARIIHQVKPVYPPELERQGIEGSVVLNAVISKQGMPVQLSVVNPSVNPALTEAAINAARQWRYQPSLLNGEPIEVQTNIQVDFTLAP